MNENINSRPAKAGVVISIKELRAILRKAIADNKSMQSYRGKVDPKHCVVLEWDLLPVNFPDGIGHLSSPSLKIA